MIAITSVLLDDGMLEVSVSDTGKGIDDIARAMQPFFTTQPEKERSGMGFSVMQTFMDHVAVESAPGRGTTVRMKKRLQEK
jgi:stage II sporulation protein AB (anti-sigma F factor)